MQGPFSHRCPNLTSAPDVEERLLGDSPAPRARYTPTRAPTRDYERSNPQPIHIPGQGTPGGTPGPARSPRSEYMSPHSPQFLSAYFYDDAGYFHDDDYFFDPPTSERDATDADPPTSGPLQYVRPDAVVTLFRNHSAEHTGGRAGGAEEAESLDRSGEEQSRYETAAVLVDAFLHGPLRRHTADSQVLMRSKMARTFYKVVSSLWLVRKAVLTLAVLMLFFEVPKWCREQAGFEYSWPVAQCNADHPLSGLPYMPMDMQFALDLVVGVFLLFETACQCQFNALPTWQSLCTVRQVGQCAPSGLLVAAKLLLTLGFLAYVSLGLALCSENQHPSFSGYFRIVLVIVGSPALRSTFHILFRLLPKVLEILVLILVYVMFSAALFLVIFEDLPEGQEYFKDYPTALTSLWILLTTANNPDVWLPVYDEHRWMCVLFIVYLAVGVLLLLNLFLAIVYDAYKTLLHRSHAEEAAARRICLLQAFQMLDGQQAGYITARALHGMVTALNSYLALPAELQEQIAALTRPPPPAPVTPPAFAPPHSPSAPPTPLYATPRDFEGPCMEAAPAECSPAGATPSRAEVGRGGAGSAEGVCIRQAEFVALVADLRLRHWARSGTLASRIFPGTVCRGASWQRVQAFIRDWRFDLIVNVLVVANMVIVIWEVHMGLEDRWATQDTLQALEIVCGYLYMLEVALKVWAFGWDEFWHSPLSSTQNRFDLHMSAAIGAAQTYTLVPFTEFNNRKLIRYLQLVRLTRFMRLIHRIPNYRTIAATAAVVIPSLSQLIFAYFCILAVFAVLGTQLFGGLIHLDNPALRNTAYYRYRYQDINFNDFGSAMLLLFNVVILNDWNYIMWAYEAASGRPWATRLYFLLFWVVAVVYVLNLAVAFILEAFRMQMDLITKEREHARQRELAKERDSRSGRKWEPSRAAGDGPLSHAHQPHNSPHQFVGHTGTTPMRMMKHGVRQSSNGSLSSSLVGSHNSGGSGMTPRRRRSHTIAVAPPSSFDLLSQTLFAGNPSPGDHGSIGYGAGSVHDSRDGHGSMTRGVSTDDLFRIQSSYDSPTDTIGSLLGRHLGIGGTARHVSESQAEMESRPESGNQTCMVPQLWQADAVHRHDVRECRDDAEGVLGTEEDNPPVSSTGSVEATVAMVGGVVPEPLDQP